MTVTLFAADAQGNPTGNAIATQPTVGIRLRAGTYRFDNLLPGDYVVQLTNLPAGYVSSTGKSGNALGPVEPGNARFTAADDNTDHGTQTNATTITSTKVTLLAMGNPNDANGVAGNGNLNVDLGLLQPASLGDFVFLDTDQNGVQGANEPGIKGVTVTLYDGTGTTVLATTATDKDGKYTFTNLGQGSYVVGFTPPGGYGIIPQGKGEDRTKDSDANPATGKTAPVTLAPGDNNPTIDAGLFTLPPPPVAALGDLVFLDANGNGIQDAGEKGIAGVTVTLFDGTGKQVGTLATTDANGLYSFTGLTPGDYSVQFTPPAGSGLVFSPPLQGTDTAKDSNADTTTGKTAVVTLNAGDNNVTIDAGLFQPASLGDLVFFDANKNGIQDAGEKGVAGVTVTLFDGTGKQVGTPATTDANGLYSFTGLTPGDYSVQFTPPAGYVVTAPNQGTDTAKDSNADTATGKTAVVTLASGENNPTIDAGLYGTASLGDKVFRDDNGDGVQGPNEPGIDGVAVTLFDAAGTPVGTTTTANGGVYGFTNLPPGSYTVQFTPPAGFTSHQAKNAGSSIRPYFTTSA